MPQTSLSSWTKVQQTLPYRQFQVWYALREMGNRATMHGVAVHLQVPLHTISGRFSELKKKGMIREFDTVAPKNGCKRTVWEVSP